MKLRVRGLRELDRALSELPKATARNVLKRAARTALEPMRAAAEAKAPVASGDLQVSIVLSEKRTRRVKKSNPAVRQKGGGFRRSASTNYAIAMGPSSGEGVLNYAALEEFGSANNPPQPFMRPAWDSEKQATLDRLIEELTSEIGRAAERARRRALKARPKR